MGHFMAFEPEFAKQLEIVFAIATLYEEKTKQK